MKSRRMKAARMLKGLSQHGLAERVGCSESRISRIETGRATAEDNLKQRIAEVLEIPTYEIGA